MKGHLETTDPAPLQGIAPGDTFPDQKLRNLLPAAKAAG